MRDPSWRPALVALDIDGTLVDHDGVMPAEIIEAITQVKQAGVPIVIATGRSWHATVPIIERLELPPGSHVCTNGAVVASYPPYTVERAITFDAAEIIAKVHAFAPHAAIAVEDPGQGYRLTKPFPDGELAGVLTYESVEQLGVEPVTRVIVRDSDADDTNFRALVEQLGLQGVSYFVGWTAWLDISPPGVNKATGLDWICTRLGIDPAAVLAIGDGSNDVDMLRWAGRGVALGDGSELAQAAADVVAPGFHDGGTWRELQRWFA
ncbi:MAG: HAD family hydrolase [Propionibacteriaceae bacterium]